MADSLRTRLGKLFSGNTVVRRIGKKQIKVVDTSRLQSGGNVNTTRRVDRYNRVHGTSAHGRYGLYNQNFNYHSTKLQLFRDYEAMDMDSILNSALDIYADEVTTKNEDGDILKITSDNEEVKKILHNLFYDILNIDFHLWMWVRNMCKYGDFYLALDINEELGVVTGVPLSAYEVVREEGFDENDPYKPKFTLENGTGQELEAFEIAHFRLLNDSNFLPYGKSMLEGARKTWKALSLMEDAMLIHRVMRAPEKRVFKVDVGNLPPADVDAHMSDIINSLKKSPFIDPQTGEYNLRFNLQNMLEDYFLPVRGDKSGTEIDTLPGMEYTGIDDIEYLKNRMMAGLKIPKAFLGYEEGIEGKATLAQEDIRFARTIERIQRIIVSELTKIAVIHLYVQGYEDAELVNFELELTYPSIVYKQEQVQLWTEQVNLAQSMIDANIMNRHGAYKKIFDMSDQEIKDIEEGLISDAKFAFRLEQIQQEGNDPQVTGESYGTKHDLASMAYKTNESIPDIESDRDYDNVGRPKKPTSYGDRDSNFGDDPLGKKNVSKTFAKTDKVSSPLKHKFNNGS